MALCLVWGFEMPETCWKAGESSKMSDRLELRGSSEATEQFVLLFEEGDQEGGNFHVQLPNNRIIE